MLKLRNKERYNKKCSHINKLKLYFKPNLVITWLRIWVDRGITVGTFSEHLHMNSGYKSVEVIIVLIMLEIGASDFFPCLKFPLKFRTAGPDLRLSSNHHTLFAEIHKLVS